MVPTLTIERYATGWGGTFGRAAVTNTIGVIAWHSWSLEEQWKNNQDHISCIPAGRYRAMWCDHPQHGWCYELQDVPERTAILLHPANTEEDLEGCIAFGRVLGELAKPDEEDPQHKVRVKPAVLGSRDAYEGFLRAVNKAPEILVVITWMEGIGERAVPAPT